MHMFSSLLFLKKKENSSKSQIHLFFYSAEKNNSLSQETRHSKTFSLIIKECFSIPVLFTGQTSDAHCVSALEVIVQQDILRHCRIRRIT